MARSNISLLAILLVAVLTGHARASLFSVPKCLKCPDDPDLPIGCLKNIIPPWPICLFHDVDYFRKVALDGATRCCDGEDAAADMSACRCPKKDKAQFLDSIGDWCKGVSSCPTDDPAEVGVDTGVEADAAIASE